MALSHLKGGAILAPMAGVTDRVFRRLCRREGCVLAYTEMVSAKGLCHGNAATARLMAVDDDETAVVLQLFGSEPAVFEQALTVIDREKFAAIDINMGCPVRKVTCNSEGSALMRDPVRASQIIAAAVKAATDTPVTVKFRRGWDDDHLNAVEFAQMAEASGAAAVCVHPRTAQQAYRGKAHWETIARVKAAVGIPVIGNGDVKTACDAEKMLRETGCDGVMIGRAALGNPWIFSQAKALLSGGPVPEVTLRRRVETAMEHARMLAEEKPEKVAVLQMRKHVAWYMQGMHGAAALRKQVNGCLSLRELLTLLGDYLRENA